MKLRFSIFQNVMLLILMSTTSAPVEARQKENPIIVYDKKSQNANTETAISTINSKNNTPNDARSTVVGGGNASINISEPPNFSDEKENQNTNGQPNLPVSVDVPNASGNVAEDGINCPAVSQLEIMANWGTSSECFDLNDDNTVDAMDLAIFLGSANGIATPPSGGDTITPPNVPSVVINDCVGEIGVEQFVMSYQWDVDSADYTGLCSNNNSITVGPSLVTNGNGPQDNFEQVDWFIAHSKQDFAARIQQTQNYWKTANPGYPLGDANTTVTIMLDIENLLHIGALYKYLDPYFDTQYPEHPNFFTEEKLRAIAKTYRYALEALREAYPNATISIYSVGGANANTGQPKPYVMEAYQIAVEEGMFDPIHEMPVEVYPIYSPNDGAYKYQLGINWIKGNLVVAKGINNLLVAAGKPVKLILPLYTFKYEYGSVDNMKCVKYEDMKDFINLARNDADYEFNKIGFWSADAVISGSGCPSNAKQYMQNLLPLLQN